jgi:hypothetical protein
VSYVGDNNQVFPGDMVSLADSAPRTTNGSGPAVAVEAHNTVRAQLNITAASGTTPSMTVTIETSSTGSGGWTTVGTAFAAATTTGVQRRVASSLDRFIRVTWAITGTTPSFTFSVSGELV